MSKHLKVYGTRKRGHRERWIVKGKRVYREVRRDKKGRFISAKKWSPKKPIGKEVFTEIDPLIVDYDTGKEALSKMRETTREWEWIKFEAES
jgi:hypothetical protein